MFAAVPLTRLFLRACLYWCGESSPVKRISALEWTELLIRLADGSSGGGSNIDPATAAKQHIQWVKDLGGSYQIGAPAVTNGQGDSVGAGWLKVRYSDSIVQLYNGGRPVLTRQKFLAACAGNCKIDFVPFHWYGGGGSAGASGIIQQAKTIKAALAGTPYSSAPLWLTEVCPLLLAP